MNPNKAFLFGLNEGEAMGVMEVNPYWHDKDYKPPTAPKKKKKYGGKQKRKLTKEEYQQSRKPTLPWEIG